MGTACDPGSLKQLYRSVTWVGGGAPLPLIQGTRGRTRAWPPARRGTPGHLRGYRHQPQATLERGALSSGGVTPLWSLRSRRRGHSRPVLRRSLLYCGLARSSTPRARPLAPTTHRTKPTWGRTARDRTKSRKSSDSRRTDRDRPRRLDLSDHWGVTPPELRAPRSSVACGWWR